MNFFVIIWKKFKEYCLARPRILKMPGMEGEILLRNFTPEQAEVIKKLFDDKIKENVPKPGDLVLETPNGLLEVVSSTEMNEIALGLYYNKQKLEYQVVTVKYNPITGAAKVESMKNAGSYKLSGVNTLKMQLVNLGVI